MSSLLRLALKNLRNLKNSDKSAEKEKINLKEGFFYRISVSPFERKLTIFHLYTIFLIFHHSYTKYQI